MIDYNTFTINTNIILLFNNVYSKLFYTIIFINYCNCYKLYTQCWPYQIFVHGALHGVSRNHLEFKLIQPQCKTIKSRQFIIFNY